MRSDKQKQISKTVVNLKRQLLADIATTRQKGATVNHRVTNESSAEQAENFIAFPQVPLLMWVTNGISTMHGVR